MPTHIHTHTHFFTHTFVRFRQVALAALPCLSSAGADPIRSRAEALFERLAFLDGDGVWLLLMQTMDTAAQYGYPRQHQSQGASGGGGALKRAAEKGRGGGGRRIRSMPRPVAAPVAAAAGAAGASAAAPAAAVSRRRQGSASVSDGGAWFWLPEPPYPEAAAYTTGLSRALVGGGRGRRPAVLLEGRSVFAGRPGRVASECAPAAARLLGLLSADGAPAVVEEHM